ncbi:MAG: DUF4389 domain-containing protein [Vicinamibacterales bacterium]|nr:DUF4389 domain-containing protein [Vicinamibacterales bacterium]
MNETDRRLARDVSGHSVRVEVAPALDGRNRLTTAFRIILAIPHLILVGGPIAAGISWSSASDARTSAGGGGLLGVVATVCAIISWFAIVFTGRHPQGLWDLTAYYLRWRVRAGAYTALLRDEYPPFGEGPYPAELTVAPPVTPRNRWTVAFRLVLVLPHLLVVWLLGFVWALTSLFAWVSILVTGRYPTAMYGFGVGMLRWSSRVEAYLLLLDDEYPPFALE